MHKEAEQSTSRRVVTTEQPPRRGASALSISASIAVLLVLAAVSASITPVAKDYISYWSAGHLLARHGNPYSVSKVFALEQAQGYTRPRPLVMRNPPWALFAVLPLGFLRARSGLILWLGASVGCVVLFLQRCRVAPAHWLLACSFGPVILCLLTGQSSPFLLLGLVGFLTLETSSPFFAGATLLFLAFKPNVLLLFWVVWLVDAVYRRRFRMVSGAGAAIGMASLIAMYFDPRIWSHYLGMLRDEQIGESFLPTPSFLLRKILLPHEAWLQLVPTTMAVVWALWFYVRYRRSWRWSVHMMPLLFMSVWSSPYVWMTDEIVLLPAVVATLAQTDRPKRSRAILAALSLAVFVLLLRRLDLPSGAYIWTSTAWLAWYLYSGGWSQMKSVRSPQADALQHG